MFNFVCSRSFAFSASKIPIIFSRGISSCRQRELTFDKHEFEFIRLFTEPPPFDMLFDNNGELQPDAFDELIFLFTTMFACGNLA